MAPTYPQGSWFSQLWIYTTWGCFHTSSSFPGWLVSEKKIFKDDSVYSYVKHRPPIVAQTYPQGSWFSQIWIYTTWVCFQTSFSFPGTLVFEKKIFKVLLYIFLCKTSTLHCGPTLPLGIMIFTTLNLHYQRILSHKFQLSWLISFWEEFFF